MKRRNLKYMLYSLLVLCLLTPLIMTYRVAKPTSNINSQIGANGIVKESNGEKTFWDINGTRITHHEGPDTEPQIIADGSGGAIIAWTLDEDEMGDYDIYAQKIDSGGAMLWDTDGKGIRTGSSEESDAPFLCTDGYGGALIAWADSENGRDLFIRRINSGGDLLWLSDIDFADPLTDHRIISDDNEGAVLVYIVADSGGSDYNIYAQKINSTGDFVWTKNSPNGVVICNHTADSNDLEICSDGDGGAIVAWREIRGATDNDIYTQRIDKNGNTRWRANGTVICNATNAQTEPQICQDGEGGAIIVWKDGRSVPSDMDIYAQKIDKDGNIKWDTNGTIVCNATNIQETPVVCQDGEGGAIIAWDDERDGPGSASRDIYAQRIYSDKTIAWGNNGTVICNVSTAQDGQKIISDGNGNAIIAWQDSRHTSDAIYAQKIKGDGTLLWGENGTRLSQWEDSNEDLQLCSDGYLGAIVTWETDDFGFDIFAQKIGYSRPSTGALPGDGDDDDDDDDDTGVVVVVVVIIVLACVGGGVVVIIILIKKGIIDISKLKRK